MKKIKITVFAILVLTGCLFMGELSILNLDTFQEEYYEADFYINSSNKEITSKGMIIDLCRAGEMYNVDFFAVEHSWNKSYLYETKIIGTEGAIEHLKKNGIKEGENKSIFFEKQNVTFHLIDYEKNISDINTYYFIGGTEEYNKICAFKAELVDKYGGGFPKEKGSDAETFLNTLAVWGIIFCIVLALSIYEVAYMKKEIMIRIIMGENIFKFFFKNIALDMVAFIFIFGTMFFILRYVSNVTFKLHWVICLFILFLFLNGAIYTKILILDYKRDLSSIEGDNGLLAINYIIKAVLAIITILVISVNYTMVNNSLNIYKQRDFFDSHNNCSYYKFSYGFDSISENDDPDEEIYREFYDEFQECSYQYADLSDYYNMKYPFVVINRNSFDEISKKYSQIAEVRSQVLKNKITLLVPENIQPGSDDFENAMEVNDGTFFAETEYGKWNTIMYDNGIDVIGIHNSGTGYSTNNYEDPVILVDNTKYINNPGSTGYDYYYNYDIMYDISEKDWTSFTSNHKLKENYISITNVEDEYIYKWNQSKRRMMLSLVFTTFVLFLEISLIILIINMEYQFNATEMALRKVHGYSLYERNIRLIQETCVLGTIGIIIAIIFDRILYLNIHIYSLVIVGALLILIEIICIFIKANSVERHRLYTILKGERI